MNNKIKRFFAILGAVLLSLLMVLFSVFYVFSFSSSLVFADTESNSPVSSDTYSEFSVFGSNVTSVIGQQQIYLQTIYPQDNSNAGYIKINLQSATPNGVAHFDNLSIEIDYAGFSYQQQNGVSTQVQFYFQFLTFDLSVIASCYVPSSQYNSVVIDSSYVDYYSGYNSSSAFQYVYIYVKPYSTSLTYYNSWFQIFRFYASYSDSGETQSDFLYQSYLYDIMSSSSVPAYQFGYNQGYTYGKDVGLSSQFSNPLKFFTEPVDAFFNINIFGNFSIGDILSVILFVLIALMFIKMFAGG